MLLRTKSHIQNLTFPLQTDSRRWTVWRTWSVYRKQQGTTTEEKVADELTLVFTTKKKRLFLFVAITGKRKMMRNPKTQKKWNLTTYQQHKRKSDDKRCSEAIQSLPSQAKKEKEIVTAGARNESRARIEEMREEEEYLEGGKGAGSIAELTQQVVFLFPIVAKKWSLDPLKPLHSPPVGNSIWGAKSSRDEESINPSSFTDGWKREKGRNLENLCRSHCRIRSSRLVIRSVESTNSDSAARDWNPICLISGSGLSDH